MRDVHDHQVLCKARNLLDREGWCQHALQRRGSYCALGAIHMAAFGGVTRFAEGFKPTPGFKALADVVGLKVDKWNNAPERTKAEVLAAFDRAIAQTAPAPPWDSLPTPQSEVEASDTVEVGA